jgi:hypothetical protein
MESEDTPLFKKDNLNRIIYIRWNSCVRVINKYYGDTHKLKIKYRIYNDETSIEIYDQNQEVIGSYESNKFSFKMSDKLTIYKNKLFFKVAQKTLSNWKKIIDE